MPNRDSLDTQIASVVETLAKTAVTEICKVVDSGCLKLRLEIYRKQKEIEALRTVVNCLTSERTSARRTVGVQVCTDQGLSVKVLDKTHCLKRKLPTENYDSPHTNTVKKNSQDRTEARPTGDTLMACTDGHKVDKHLITVARAEVNTHSHTHLTTRAEMPAQSSQHTHVMDQLREEGEKQRVTQREAEMHPTDTDNTDTHHLSQIVDHSVNDFLGDDVNLHCLTQTQPLRHPLDPTSPLTHTHLSHTQDATSPPAHTREPVGFGELQLELKAEQLEGEEEQNLHQGACDYRAEVDGHQGQMKTEVSEVEFGTVEQSDSTHCETRGVEENSANLKDVERFVSHSNMQLGLSAVQTSWPHPLSPAHIKQEEEVCTISDTPLNSLTSPQAFGDAHSTVQQEVTSQDTHFCAERVVGGMRGSTGLCRSPAHHLGTAVAIREAPPEITHGTGCTVSSLLCKRRIQCSECGKSFDRQSHFERHWRIHTGERPYGCSICGRRFTQKSNLKGHLSTHTGEKRYRCPRPFSTASPRNRLQRSHQHSRLASAW
ncbi:hypothetical protein ACEWY4_006071 [Coilia grayii]|uniref:C2H2-type domain-containing protein n=1 Tax=Coilia grayii TaxID=363190 RepID=A0ABD1KCN7_9TELE